MFLIARLIGIVTYGLMLILTCFFILKTNNTKKIKLLLLFYLCILVLMGYFFVPYITSDLYILMYISELYASMPFDSILEEMLNKKTPGAVFYFYLIGQIHNSHFLPAISALIDFALLFSILNYEIKRSKTKSSFVASVLFLFMSSGIFMSSITGIRNMMAYSIIVWCIYREFILNKSFILHFPLYLIAASLHVMGQVMLVYRILFFLFEKSSTYFHKIFKLVLMILLIILVISHGQYFLNGILDTGTGYAMAYQEGNDFSYIWATILSIIKLPIFLYEIVLFYKFRKYFKRQGNYLYLSNMINFLLPVFIMSFFSLFLSSTIFYRNVMFMLIFSLPLTIILLKSLPDYNQKRVQFNLLIVSIIILIISSLRGDLCSLKFFT